VPANLQTGAPFDTKKLQENPHSPPTHEHVGEIETAKCKESGQESSKTTQEMSAPRAGDSKVDKTKPAIKTPAAVEREAAISPQEQETLVTGKEPKKRGRKPNPESKAKAKAKAKARSKQNSKQKKTRAAASTSKGDKKDAPLRGRKAKSKGATKTTTKTSDEHEEDPPQSETRKTRKTRKSKSKAADMSAGSLDTTPDAKESMNNEEVDHMEPATSSSSPAPHRSKRPPQERHLARQHRSANLQTKASRRNAAAATKKVNPPAKGAQKTRKNE
jgi:hypothetical protein